MRNYKLRIKKGQKRKANGVLAQVDLGIVPDVQALAETFDRCIMSHDRMVQNNLLNRSIASDD